MTDPLDQSIRRGTRAVLITQIASQLVSLATLAGLYRLVGPESFGVLGMAVPFLMLARLLATFGLNVAAVQQPQLDDRQLNALFWAVQLCGLLAAGALASCGPMLSWVYQTPELTLLCGALAGSLLVGSWGITHQALLERRLQLGRLAVCRLIAQLAGGLAALIAAWQGMKVAALVLQMYVELLVLAVASWRCSDWRPTWPGRSGGSRLWRFGGWYSAAGLLFFLAQNLDKILLSYWLGSTASGRAVLGLYNQAFNLMMKPVYLVTTPLTGIALPALSRARADAPRYRDLAAKFMRMTGILLFPCAVGLTVMASDVMLVMGGSDWSRAGQLLAVMAPTIFVQGLINLCGSLFASKGLADRLCWGAFANAVLLAQGFIAAFLYCRLISADDLQWAWTVACAGTLVTVVVFALPYLAYCLLNVGLPPGAVASDLRWSLTAAMAMGCLVVVSGRLMPSTSSLTRCLVLIPVGVASYLLLARRELRWLRQQL